ncbi:MAG: hypothetical protein COX57_10650 [Alphaproteobacteria bacterium CG_4_10_14_0_2_um_filter_63_37]|nr:MAG: hypothetical protein AUJ55_10605 [Proteobacteria bacterium CG1_02_64_396]PJA24041.1 MAG: hypothetical protein COX57_10650 [Alphaproteobacteria bacterium CG_4_10_14_0_2_um_filter_63_37]
MAGWLAFGLSHSWAAGNGPKRWMVLHAPRWAPAYRLIFNGVSTVAVAALLGLEYFTPTPRAWDPWSPPWGWAVMIADVAALVLFLDTLRRYDLSHFAGTKQWRARNLNVPDRFVEEGALRWIRHPLYTAGLVLVWGRPLEADQLVSATMISLYLVVGALFEERRLMQRFGQTYGPYRERTGMFLPRWSAVKFGAR